MSWWSECSLHLSVIFLKIILSKHYDVRYTSYTGSKDSEPYEGHRSTSTDGLTPPPYRQQCTTACVCHRAVQGLEWAQNAVTDRSVVEVSREARCCRTHGMEPSSEICLTWYLWCFEDAGAGLLASEDFSVQTNVSHDNTASTFSAEDGSSILLRNVGIYIQVLVTSRAIRSISLYNTSDDWL
jgi:hypothetical protein